jgi:hypothetical protein
VRVPLSRTSDRSIPAHESYGAQGPFFGGIEQKLSRFRAGERAVICSITYREQGGVVTATRRQI